MQVRVLGPLEVEHGGHVPELGGKRQRSVLAVLALHAREVIGTDRLVDVVWDGRPPASASTTLRSYVSRLRKAIGSDVLRTTKSGYVLEVDDDAIDARRFERLVADGRGRRADDRRAAVTCWTDALGLWRGDAYQDLAYADFVQAEVRRLTDLRVACTEDVFDARLELGEHEEIVGDLDAFHTANPDRERALGLYMLALYRCGRQSEALRVYDDGRRRLADELGVDPSPELRELHERIVRQEDVAVRERTPAGRQTLTFLLGDVERSTAKLRALGDEEYAAVIDQHRRVLRDAFAAHGGRAVNTKGDEVFAAFDGATGAVRAAVQAQLALCSSEVPEDRRLPVRIGLHTGEAMMSGGELVGMAIHLAARIMDAAHGGQILVSQVTKELATESASIDVGVHVLKDFPEPMRLFQVVHPDLRRDFPSLRTRSGPTDNIPTRATSFVGRDAEVAWICDALTDARVVTLTGVGGVGKTRLAQEAARELVPRYTDGVWFCELAPAGDADGLVQSIATTLGIEAAQGRSIRDTLLAAFGQRDSLVVLDNCEHLLAPVAGLVEDIVATGSFTDVLATSREPIGVEGERIRPVRSLEADAEALRLFEDRARDARPDFAVDEDNAADVVAICTRLDGIPLAIELAAPWVTSMRPSDIAVRLEEGFRFLRSGRRTAVDRHRTLHAAIDWSYAKLAEPVRLLLDRLSVFAGGFTLEAAEDVCGRGLGIDVADGLASLVAKSMVDADFGEAGVRYSLLETMRQYAQDRLGQRPDADWVLRVHAGYFVEMVESSDGWIADDESTVRRMASELENIRAAVAWSIAALDVDLAIRVASVAMFNLPAFGLGVAHDWATSAVALADAEDHPLYPVALAMAALESLQQGERGRAEELLGQALDMLDDPDDPRRLGVFEARAMGAFYEGRIDDYRQLTDEVIRLARENGEVGRETQGLGGRALMEAYAGEYIAAIRLAEASYALVRDRSLLAQGFGLYAIGEVLAEAGTDLDRAVDCLERSVAISSASGSRLQAGTALVRLATLRARLGAPVEALRLFSEVIDLWRLSGWWVQQWITLRNLAEFFGRLGSDEAAATLIAASEESSTAVPVYGAQAERLDALKDELRGRLGDAAFSAAWERGCSMPDDDVVAFAKTEIGRLLERERVTV